MREPRLMNKFITFKRISKVTFDSKSTRSITFFLCSLILFSASITHSQRNRNKKPKIIRLEDVKVEGKVAGPEAVFIINMKDLQFEGLEPKKSFIPLIIKSVEKEPF
jgi:hypothetical protein